MVKILLKLVFLLSVLLISDYALADTYIGYSHTKHLLSEGLNDSHPMVGYEKDGLGGVAFINSFDKLSLGLYNSYKFVNKGNLSVKVRYGLTTGYTKKQHRNGQTYTAHAPFVMPGVMAIVIPAVSYKQDKFTYSFEQLGDATSLSITYFLGDNNGI